MPPRMRTRSAGRHAAESLGGGTGVRVSRGGRGRRLKEGNDVRVNDLNGQGNDQGIRANGGVDGVNGNVGNQNGNVVNENVQENVRNVLVNGNRVGCSYKEFLACNPKEYDGRENAGVWPKCTTYNSYHAPEGPCRTCFNCNRPGHLAKDCRGVPRNINPVNARNPPGRACYECGCTDHV
nr:hypothetical protein [Tanacetum cinerariifolium]